MLVTMQLKKISGTEVAKSNLLFAQLFSHIFNTSSKTSGIG
jgi:hypothetical protein